VIVSNARLRSELLRPPVSMEVIALNFQRPLGKDGGKTASAKKAPSALVETQLTITPFRINLGGITPALASANFGRSNYHFDIKGDADVERLNAFLETIGLPKPDAEALATGKAKIDLSFDGAWTGFAPPQLAGILKTQAQTRAAIQ
jgi:hypothetical protein